MHKIKKAIIPVAGLATRVYPMNKITKKAFFPIYDQGRIKPVIIKLIEELDLSEIEEIYLIIEKNDKMLYESLFQSISLKIYEKLSEQDQKYDDKLNELSKKIRYIIQEEQLGFGHAVYLARDYIGTEPCILVLGDTIYKSNEQRSCVEQLLDYYDKDENIIIGLQNIEKEELKYYGISCGRWINKKKTKLLIDEIVEKPSIEYAQKHLLIDGKFYGNFGNFIITKEVFEELEKIIKNPINSGEEYQLMTAFENLIGKIQVKGLKINGISYDVGNIKAYLRTMREY